MINGRDRKKGASRTHKRTSEGSEGSNTWTVKVEETAALYPARSRSIYRRAMRGQSRKAAMDAFCIMCMGYQPYEVARCTAPECPLYPYRGR
jgi:hypothetical protein